MLRSLDEKGGIGVYTRYLIQELLDLDRRNQYVLFYRNPVHLGRFANHENVTERVVRGSNKAFWDQIAIPLACWQAKLDVLLHPKFTVPLLAPCKTVMVLHGAGWFFPEHRKFWKNWDVKYIRAMMPIYCRKAAAILSVSKLTTDTFNELFHLPAGKINTVYFGPGKHFRPIEEESILQTVKTKYSLPDRFIFTLAKYGDGGRKNTKNIFEAYRKVHGKIPHRLVVGGKEGHRFRKDYQIPTDGYGKDIIFPGWIDQEDLPAVYSMANLYLYPSNLESASIPVMEAMACGTPIITSNVNDLREVAGNAAVLVNPDDHQQIADAVYQVLLNPELRAELRAAGLARSKRFSWESCAKETLAILQNLGC